MMGGCCDALGSCGNIFFWQLTATCFFVEGEMPVCIIDVFSVMFLLKLLCGWLVWSVSLS